MCNTFSSFIPSAITSAGYSEQFCFFFFPLLRIVVWIFFFLFRLNVCIYLSVFSLNLIDSCTCKVFSNSFLYMLLKKKAYICCDVGKIKGTSLGLQIQFCPVHVFETAAVINFCFVFVTLPLLSLFTGLYGCQMLQGRHLHDLAVLFLFIVFDLILKRQLPSVIVILTSVNNVSKSNEHPGIFFTCHVFLRSVF